MRCLEKKMYLSIGIHRGYKILRVGVNRIINKIFYQLLGWPDSKYLETLRDNYKWESLKSTMVVFHNRQKLLIYSKNTQLLVVIILS